MTLSILDAREKLGALLVPVADGDPALLLSLVDSIEPPALMLGWGDPWLEPTTACFGTGRLVVTCVAGRLAPGEGVAKLEELVAYTLGRIRPAQQWPLESVTGPRVFTIAKTNYLAARITVRVPIST